MLRSEIDRILATIDAKQFTALSHGIGLGEPRQAGKTPPGRKAAVTAAPPRQAAAGPAAAPQAAAAWAPMGGGAPGLSPAGAGGGPAFGRATAQRPPAGRGAGGGLSRRLLAWSLDFLMVTASLAVAVALAAVVSAVRTGETENPLALAPVQWLIATKPVFILAWVYGICLAYGLLFKLMAGLTLGESLLRVRRRVRPEKSRQTPARGAP